ncbi:MAG TPA: cysteine--tRNA ligase [Solirubrobacteraceae bacterium]|nr:cysteine--tRNA ligase [Solirubrobacteraceae bacterium]
MAELRLYDTLAREVRRFEPREPGRVGIYACGPTVYSRVHIGNARPFVVFSLLKRFFEHDGLDVTLVINVTDVNDKIYAAAAAAGRSSVELAGEMTADYIADTDRLELGRPDHEPLASESIEAIVDYIAALIASGNAYDASGDVYFRVRSDPRYGVLSRRGVDQMDQGEEVEGVARKEDPLDFALWKTAKTDEDSSWQAPWGRGRPGWHIECSAMAESLLGAGFDIHGGGLDLLFPHHENEAAQTRCARGTELARFWVHNGMLELATEKMSKSQGNIAPLHEVLDRFGRDAVVLYFCGAHYRQPIDFADEPLEQARAGVSRLREVGRRLVDGPSPVELAPLRERFFASLAEDFNTAAALAAMWEWVREANRRGTAVGNADLQEMLDVIGLANLLEATDDTPPPEVAELAAARQRAREVGDFARADELRARILAAGWIVRDDPGGYSLVPLDG